MLWQNCVKGDWPIFHNCSGGCHSIIEMYQCDSEGIYTPYYLLRISLHFTCFIRMRRQKGKRGSSAFFLCPRSFVQNVAYSLFGKD